MNLFFVDRFSAASMIFADLPYMDTVSIRRQLPNRIIIQAEGSAPAAYMMLDGEYWFLDRNGRALGVTTALKAEPYPEIRSLQTITVIPGEDPVVEGENIERLKYAGDLLNALGGQGLIGPGGRAHETGGRRFRFPCLRGRQRVDLFPGLNRTGKPKKFQNNDILREILT